MLERLLRRFARFVTNRVVERPAAWRIFRPLFRRQWDRLAATWDQTRRPDSFDPIKAGLDLLPSPPSRALDVGTGTGGAAFAVAARFPDAKVIGVDLSGEMVDRARSKVTGIFAGRLSFQQADASSLPFPPGGFDLVTHSNMIPFFDETARVLRPGGHAIYGFSSGTETAIYVPLDRLQGELQKRGFTEFVRCSAGRGMALVARKGSAAAPQSAI
jgi:ubiquinone/menaquinone biosynthesis C-methylase UbiE